MFCPECGNPLEEGQTVCTACAEAKEAPATEQETPVTEQEVPVAEQEVPEMELNTPEEAPKPKKNLKTLIIGAVAAVAVILGLIFGLPALIGPSTPQEHLAKAEAQTLQNSSFAGVYDAMRSSATETDFLHSSTIMSVTVGDKVTDMISTMAGEGMDIDLSWLEQVQVRMDANVQEEAAQIEYAIGLNSVDLITLRAILDVAEETIFMGIPELSDTFFGIDMSEMGMDLSEMETALASSEVATEAMQKVVKALPDSKTLSNLIGKYLEIAMEQVEEVEKDSDELEVGDLSEKVTVLSAEIDQETARNMVIAVLEAMQDDKEITKILNNICDAINEMAETLEMDAEEISADDILDQIPDLIDTLEASQPGASAPQAEEMEPSEEEPAAKDAITYTVYLGSRYEIIGRSFTAPDGSSISFKTVHEGKEMATELVVETYGEKVFAIYGEGTDSDATYEIVSNGQTVCYVETIDLNNKALNNGEFIGTIRVRLGEDLAQQLTDSIPSEISALIGLADPAIQLTGAKDSVELGLYMGETMLVSLKVETKSLKDSKISTPKDYIEVGPDMSQEDLLEEVADFNFDKLLKNLEKAGVPSDYLDMLEELIDQL